MYAPSEILEKSNRVLTKHIQEPMQNNLIFQKLFPIMKVDDLQVDQLVFGNEALRIYDNIKRAPFAESNVVPSESMTRNEYGLDEYDVMVPIDWVMTKAVSKKNALSAFNWKKRGARVARQILDLRMEYDVATLVKNLTNYDSTHYTDMTSSTSWYDEDNANMIEDVKTAAATIFDDCGHMPNIGVFGSPAAFNNVVNKSYFTERVKYGGNSNVPGVVTPKAMAEILGLEEIVIASSYYKDPSDDSRTKVWGDYFILAYVKPPTGNLEDVQDSDSFGVTYLYNGFPTIDEFKIGQSRSGIDKVTHIRATSFHTHEGLNFDAAYIFKDTTASS